MSEDARDQEYWRRWGNMETQVAQLSKACESLQRDVPRAIKESSEHMGRLLAERDARYREDQQEQKHANAKTMQLWTAAVVLLGVLQLLPVLLRIFGSTPRN